MFGDVFCCLHREKLQARLRSILGENTPIGRRVVWIRKAGGLSHHEGKKEENLDEAEAMAFTHFLSCNRLRVSCMCR